MADSTIKEIKILSQAPHQEEPDGMLYICSSEIDGKKQTVYTYTKFGSLPITVSGILKKGNAGLLFAPQTENETNAKTTATMTTTPEENQATTTITPPPPTKPENDVPDQVVQQVHQVEKNLQAHSGGHFSMTALVGNLKQVYEVAIQLSKSDLVPKAYQNKPANCMIALEISGAMKMPCLMVMQNLDVIHGNTSWRGKFLKALIEQSGIYSETWYEEDDNNGGRTRLCAIKKSTQKQINGPWVSIEMAKLEKWVDKDGSKWKTMPELMRKYRAASFFAKTECPNVTMGFPDEFEAREIVDSEVTILDKSEAAKLEISAAKTKDGLLKIKIKYPEFMKESWFMEALENKANAIE